MNFVAPKNFRIGHDDKFCFFVNKAASERANMDLGSGVRVLGLRGGNLFPRSRDARRKTQFGPDFLEALTFTVVIAENLNRVILPQPAVHLVEKFTPLHLGDLGYWRAFGERTEGIE